ncbi:hypothetical protein [Epibacterium ulvae]|uniref:hypothetical protein n=1 Tax=Epibacterium ulvae TaxID=1156985 RepID=UPI00249252CB|nr:hypothetical protein [Epibacterium ulvae]
MSTPALVKSALPFFIVATMGALGGTLAHFLLALPAGVSEIDWSFKLPVEAALGALASTIFIFLLANTDRNDASRLLALSLISGFFWKPVIDAGANYYNKIGDAGDVAQFGEKTNGIQKIEQRLSTGNLSDEEAIPLIIDSAEQLNSLWGSIEDRNLKSKAARNYESLISGINNEDVKKVIEKSISAERLRQIELYTQEGLLP